MRQLFSFLFLLLAARHYAPAQPAAYPQLILKRTGQKGCLVSGGTSSFGLVKKDTTIKPLRYNVLPVNFYSQHLGAACKMELQLEKQTKLPIRIRLGSKEQVDYLEGKFSRNR